MAAAFPRGFDSDRMRRDRDGRFGGFGLGDRDGRGRYMGGFGFGDRDGRFRGGDMRFGGMNGFDGFGDFGRFGNDRRGFGDGPFGN